MISGTVFIIIIIALSIIPIVGSLALYFIMPVLFGGIMLTCDKARRGDEISFGDVFAGFSSHFSKLAGIGLAMLVFIQSQTVRLVVVGIVLLMGGDPTPLLQEMVQQPGGESRPPTEAENERVKLISLKVCSETGETPKANLVIAVDAYNGTQLWQRDIPNSLRLGAFLDCGNMVVDDHALYVAAQDRCLLLDPRTGDILGVASAPGSSRDAVVARSASPSGCRCGHIVASWQRQEIPRSAS